jgi:hypothetical protein
MLVLIVYHYLIIRFIGPAVKVYSTLLSLIGFFSWVGLTKYLRRVSLVREYIELLEKAIFSLLPFIILLFLFMAAFGSSISTKILIEEQNADHEYEHPEKTFGGKGLLEGIASQYRFMFADFSAWDDYEH